MRRVTQREWLLIAMRAEDLCLLTAPLLELLLILNKLLGKCLNAFLAVQLLGELPDLSLEDLAVVLRFLQLPGSCRPTAPVGFW